MTFIHIHTYHGHTTTLPMNDHFIYWRVAMYDFYVAIYCDIVHRFIFTGRSEVVAKVMFLQVSVCPQGGGVCLGACWDANTPPQTRQTPLGPGRAPLGPGRHPPGTSRPPWDQADPPGTRQAPPGTRQTPPGPGRPPPGSRLQHTVYYERPVRILLECILVTHQNAHA